MSGGIQWNSCILCFIENMPVIVFAWMKVKQLLNILENACNLITELLCDKIFGGGIVHNLFQLVIIAWFYVADLRRVYRLDNSTSARMMMKLEFADTIHQGKVRTKNIILKLVFGFRHGATARQIDLNFQDITIFSCHPNRTLWEQRTRIATLMWVCCWYPYEN